MELKTIEMGAIDRTPEAELGAVCELCDLELALVGGGNALVIVG